MNNIKQPSSVRGVKIACINYQMCPACYGCRAYDYRDPEVKDITYVIKNYMRNGK